jgi:hypothetical protein
MSFRDGGGQHSDVNYIILCDTHRGATGFRPVEVKRDEDGYWDHPAPPPSTAKIRRHILPGRTSRGWNEKAGTGSMLSSTYEHPPTESMMVFPDYAAIECLPPS